jgi:hypothetical protein
MPGVLRGGISKSANLIQKNVNIFYSTYLNHSKKYVIVLSDIKEDPDPT